MAKITLAIDSNLKSMEALVSGNYVFNIPRYQRLYVWTAEQVKTLLEDLHEAFRQGEDMFYLGGILVVEKNNQYDLIDGQQRFTTLWLLSYELGHSLSSFCENNEGNRLRFAIRKEVSDYFEEIRKPKHSSTQKQIVITDRGLQRIHSSRERIKSFIDENLTETDRKEFSAYLYKSLHLLFTQVPPDTDLNKLFEVTNNRGLQLEHHEILKARLLKTISAKKVRLKYGILWTACSQMNTYIEKSLTQEIGANLGRQYNKEECEFSLKGLFDKIDGGVKQEKAQQLSKILRSRSNAYQLVHTNNFKEKEPEEEARDEELQPVRSILTFPQLLLHTLRIWRCQSNLDDIPRIKEKELLKTFKDFGPKTPEAIEDFLKLVLKARVNFDAFVIKWVEVARNEEEHQIKRLIKYNQYRKRTYYFKRQGVEEDGLALLQSMLYHSQQITTQYWLSPFLLDTLYIKDKDTLYKNLRRYDNKLFCTGDKRTLPERTYDLMQQIQNNAYDDANPDLSQLRKDDGVSFPHYWFYKLEFILWFLKRSEKHNWLNFKITARNSVEHISPQKQAFSQNTVSTQLLDTFGNLGLVSRSVNSGFGNKTFLEKKEYFKARNIEKVDSLKLDLVYKNDEWNDDVCEKHCEEMLGCFEQYISTNS